MGHRGGHDVVVLGVPRGGVVVAAEVARGLQAPLDMVGVRKVGVPWAPELAMGAVAEGGVVVLDDDVVARSGLSDQLVERAVEAERRALDDLVRDLRTSPPIDIHGLTAIVVDDGIATGSTARAACLAARARGAARLVLAAPVAARDSVASFVDADEVVCVEQPHRFRAVGEHYRVFWATTEDEVVDLLADAARRCAATGTQHTDRDPVAHEQQLRRSG